MRTNIFSIMILLLITSFIISSCEKDPGDTTPPVIRMNSPEDDAIFKIGDEHGIHLDMELSDNEMLSSYKVEIHSNFDGHDHDHSKSDVPFAFQKSWDISGKKNATIHHHEITIPQNSTPGEYHLMIFCTDAAGNEAYAARDIILSNDEAIE